MSNIDILILVLVLVVLVVLVIILDKLHKKKSSKSMKVGATNACAYILQGSRSADCQQWMQAYATGNPCVVVDDAGSNAVQVDCQDALACCNAVCSCDNGQNCVDQHDPMKNPQAKYDVNSAGQCVDQN